MSKELWPELLTVERTPFIALLASGASQPQPSLTECSLRSINHRAEDLPLPPLPPPPSPAPQPSPTPTPALTPRCTLDHSTPESFQQRSRPSHRLNDDELTT
ncbi:hypothetical protein V3C99_000769 [Haemonchus contortus]|uniref:Uncharacterized protein n=1 Tax=Haemonchus contortus TaxID=6289 RepID=A0A7I5E9I5_HAECO